MTAPHHSHDFTHMAQERGVLMEGFVRGRRVENLEFMRVPDPLRVGTDLHYSRRTDARDANVAVPNWYYNVSVPILHLLGKRWVV